jgi:hypothetical protein
VRKEAAAQPEVSKVPTRYLLLSVLYFFSSPGQRLVLSNEQLPNAPISFSEQICVRPGPDEEKIIDVAVAMMLPIAAQRVVLVTYRQGTAVDQKQNCCAQLCHVFSASLGKLHIAQEFRAKNRIPHA